MTDPSNPRVRAFWLPRQGNAVEEYEDASASEVASGRFALADGATESSFAGLWARLLVEAFVREPGPLLGRPWPEWLAPLWTEWDRQVSGPLPWYAEDKRQEGAFATFLGLVVQPTATGEQRTWQALAVGDTCLFHVRDASLLTSFPVQSAQEFGNNPPLLGSRPAAAAHLAGQEVRLEGVGEPGDRLLLMTDALALWFLRQAEAGGQPWEPLTWALSGPTPDEGFASWVGRLRSRRELRNDDVTLMEVRL